MKKGVSNVIFLVIAIILGVLVLAVSMKLLKNTNQSLSNQEKEVNDVIESFNTQTLEATCKELTSGKTTNYRADVFLEELKFPELLKTMPNIWNSCGSELEQIALECYKNINDETENCNGNYIKVRKLKNAFNICKAFFIVKTICQQKCPDNLDLCVYGLLDKKSNEVCNGYNLNIDDTDINEVCNG